ncbi:MAG: hypothetical protein ACERLM_04210 [Acidimicrobiales bacterium]
MTDAIVYVGAHAEGHDQTNHQPAQLERERDLCTDDERRGPDRAPERGFSHA